MFQILPKIKETFVVINDLWIWITKKNSGELGNLSGKKELKRGFR